MPDLLGLRLLGRHTTQTVRRLLPRVRREQLLRLLGVDQLQPADGPLEWITNAALAAAGLDSLHRSSREAMAVRRAVVAVAGRRLSVRQLAALFDVSPRSISSLKQRPPDEQLVAATRLQLGLMAHLRT